MNDEFRVQSVIWMRLGLMHPRPPTTTCIFTDGIASYWVGWWSNEETGIRIWGPRWRTLLDMPAIQRMGIKWWAELGNFETVSV